MRRGRPACSRLYIRTTAVGSAPPEAGPQQEGRPFAIHLLPSEPTRKINNRLSKHGAGLPNNVRAQKRRQTMTSSTQIRTLLQEVLRVKLIRLSHVRKVSSKNTNKRGSVKTDMALRIRAMPITVRCEIAPKATRAPQ